MAGSETPTLVPSFASGVNVRTITATVLVNGVPTAVQMQVLSLADAEGNVIEDFIDYEWQRAMLDETRAIRLGMQMLLSSEPKPFDTTTLDLLAEAQALREEQEA